MTSRRNGGRGDLGSPCSVPYIVVFRMQSFHVLAGLLARMHAAICLETMASHAYLLPQTNVVTAVEDAKRLVKELQCGIEGLADSIRADVVFDGVASTASEVEAVLGALTMD